MNDLLEWIWFGALLILTGYHMMIFRKRTSTTAFYEELLGVTVVIAHKNDTAVLAKGLGNIARQDYPVFEILIVDDNSQPDEKEKLIKMTAEYDNVRLIFSEGNGKKEALVTGIEQAGHEKLLFTDADCCPETDQWIRSMVTSGRPREIVIGYSPFYRSAGILNFFIRFETVMTAIQYLSWAQAGRPYMAVGRNILVPRFLMTTKKPYAGIAHIPYGDDDLMLQEMLRHTRVVTSSGYVAHMMTIAPPTFREWWSQKHRHLSAGHHYRKTLWLQPGLYGISLIIHWFLLPVLFLYVHWWTWLPVMLIGLCIRWWRYADWTKTLKSPDTVLMYPFLEVAYTFYLLIMGTYSIFFKRKTWS